MKYILSFFLVLVLLAGLASCSEPEAVTYYYLRQKEHYLSGTENGIIVGETREAAGSVQNLQDLLILYLHGPSNDTLRPPFPKGTTLMGIEQQDSQLTVRLSHAAGTLEETDWVLACACLAQTCFGLTEAGSVTITAAEMSLTLTRNSLLLVDTATAPSAE